MNRTSCIFPYYKRSHFVGPIEVRLGEILTAWQYRIFGTGECFFRKIMYCMKVGEHMKFQSVPRKSRWCTAVQQSFSIELVSHLHVRDNEWHHVCISHNFRSYRTHDRYIPQFNQVPNASNEITVAYYTTSSCC